MRALTQRQAQRCEDAEGKRCKCRCAGRLHGAHRGHVVALPELDPHHAEPPKDRARR